MKKVVSSIVLVMSVFMVFALGGCQNNQTDELPVPGQWVESDLFVSEWLGIQFQLPAGWDAPSDRELEQILGAGALLLEYTDVELSEEMVEAMEDNVAHDMYVINYITGSTVQIMLERVPRALRNMEMDKVLEQSLEHLEDMGVEHSTIRNETVYIGELEFHVIDVVMNVFGMELHMSTFINLKGRNIISIAIGATDQSVIDDILGYFNVVGAQRIESVVPDFEIPEVDEGLVVGDFVGLWDWDTGDYTYDFREDGTGVRGFPDTPDLLEEFTWELINGELQIRIGMMTEVWRPTIEGNVLTINSLQVEGVSYSYIRR
jgi:hypothetical protein